jgi:hypothetical protein
MPPEYLTPGVYVEEQAGVSHAIEGVSTTTTVFIGWAARGLVGCAPCVTSFAEFERQFGGLDERSYLGYAIYYFFKNGGTRAHVARLVAGNATTASVTLGRNITVSAISPGRWGNDYAVEIRPSIADRARFSFVLWHRPPKAPAVVVERFDELSIVSGAPGQMDDTINARSLLVRVSCTGNPAVPLAGTPASSCLAAGNDGDILAPTAFDLHLRERMNFSTLDTLKDQLPVAWRNHACCYCRIVAIIHA